MRSKELVTEAPAGNSYSQSYSWLSTGCAEGLGLRIRIGLGHPRSKTEADLTVSMVVQMGVEGACLG